MDLTQIWQETMKTMQVQISRQDFDTWLRGAMLLSLEKGIATIGAPTPKQKEGLENHYMAPLRRSIGDILGFPVQVRFVVAHHPSDHRLGGNLPSAPCQAALPAFPETPLPSADSPQSEGRESAFPLSEAGDGVHPGSHVDHQTDPPSRAVSVGRAGFGSARFPLVAHAPAGHRDEQDQGDVVQLDLNSAMRAGMLNPKYTFMRFIVGSSNRLAHAACTAVADHPAMAYNPLFIYGGVGLGKTHLLHAIGNRVLDRDPAINVLYVSSEKFTNDLINAIRRQQAEEFRVRYRNIDVLLIDDIQFIAGKDATQEELFHTFNTLHAASKQIVISSDRPPKAILTLEERLRSRFEWGLIVDIQPPDLETRTAILRDKGEQLSIPVPPEVIDFLAAKIHSNIRELEGSINRVAAYAQMHNSPITVEIAAAALAELLDQTRHRRVTPEMVIDAVCAYYGLEVEHLLGRGRSRNVVIPRQVAMYLLREETGCSLVEIGTILGGRDHTTVMYGCEKVAEEMENDSRLRNEVLAIRARIDLSDR